MEAASRRREVVATVVGVLTVVIVGALDRSSPTWVSLAVLYVLVVVATTSSAGLAPGLIVAGASAVAWALGETRADSWWPNVMGDALRFLALAVVAVLVWRLATALVAARRAEQRSREFLASAAHQLRTPVASAQATAAALLHTESSPRQEQLLAALSTETARTGRLITSLLRMARLDQGETVRLQPTDLTALVRHEVERLRQRTPLDVCAPADTAPMPMVMDAAATSDALANVLDNARRHAGERIDVEVRRGRGEVAIVVSDDGPGLPAGAEERAFERFVSLDGGGGAGLGLAIARSLLRAQGGDVRYLDKAFVLRLPMRKDGEAREQRRTTPATTHPRSRAGGPSE